MSNIILTGEHDSKYSRKKTRGIEEGKDMDTVVKLLCVISLIWLAGWSDSNCEHPTGPPPDIGDVSDPDPSDSSTDVPIEPVLSWHMDGETGDGAYTYDVYFGTGENLKDPLLVVENLDSNEYRPGALDFETTYSWRVIATERGAYSPGDHRISEGPLWSFTTYYGVIIDEGFEGEFPPADWWAESAWDQSDQSHTGESSARGTMIDTSYGAELLSPKSDSYNDSGGSLDLSFYYKREIPDRTPKLKFYILNSGAPATYLFSDWVNNDEWELAEYTVRRSDLGYNFRVGFRTYCEEPLSKNTCVLIDDLLVKDSALE
ncbi:MAG: hypothetical protein JSW52_02885 [Candidatus Coatesbacteria bacterium]|nr:MAG: hypothetical protein JSW52_02885 [Candidatus Coatesbacteria bacterium]